MAENKKHNKQIPEEAIKGPAGQDAKFTVASVSNQQILANSDKEKYETLVTMQLQYESIMSTELVEGSKVKAYDDDKTKLNGVNNRKKAGMSR